MTLRTKLAAAFALFAAVPLAAAFWPVSRALSGALEAEHAARLEGAAQAVERELARLGEQASQAVADLAGSAEAEAFARERESGGAAADEAGRAAEWGAARGLDVLSVAEPDGQVVSSRHLPGRAGDVDAELAALFAAAPPGRAVPRIVSRAGPDGVEPVLALVAWRDLPFGGPPLRVAGGVAVARELAGRLSALTGGAVAIRSADGIPLAEAPPPRPAVRPRGVRALLGGLGGSARQIVLGPPDAPVAHIEVSVASDGLARARAVVLLAFLGALAAGTIAAAGAGRLLASRVTRPVEALREAAARVASGDLSARVEAPAPGELADLVNAFNAMTAELSQSRARLAQAERIAAWREVARRLAHEIKNPLTPIAMSVETLRDALDRGRPDFREILDESARAISEEVRRLKRVVDEFSRFARLPAPERVRIQPGEIVSAALALYREPPPGVEVIREIEPGLPDVLADRDQVLQVLLNLVGNALDAMPSGGTLRVGAARAPEGVALSVRDSGPGIAPGDLERVFEPYFTTKEGGTGLGLAIAHRIAEEHGGRLEVRSAPGEGATFVLTLPAAGGASPAARVPAS